MKPNVSIFAGSYRLRPSTMIGRSERAFDAREVRMAVLVPVGDDDERIGALERVVVRRRDVTRSPSRRCASCIATGSCATTVAPASSSSSISVSAGASRMSSVLRLEREPPDGDARAAELVADHVRCSFANRTCFCSSFASSTASSTRQRRAALVGGAEQRLHVLRKARAAVAGTRKEERRTDAIVAADALAHDDRRPRRRARRGPRSRS